MAGWKSLGHSATGIRSAMVLVRMHHQRGLESYLMYSLDAAAGRMEQLEAALVAAGVPIPEPKEDKLASAIAMAEVMADKGYSGRDIAHFVWAQWGNDAKLAVIEHFSKPVLPS